MTETRLPIGAFQLNRSAWPRQSLDPSRVGEFFQLYLESGLAALPPIEVVPSGDGTFLVADGAHRLSALQQTNVTEVPCVVLPVLDGQDPVLIGFVRGLEASATTAKPLTFAEKRAAADRLIAETPEASDSEIGRLTGLSHQTVGRRRLRHLSNGQLDPVTPDQADQYVVAVSARDIAAKMVGSIDRLWKARGLSDIVMGNRTGKHLARAMVDYFGDDAQQWACRFADWANTAVTELGKNPP